VRRLDGDRSPTGGLDGRGRDCIDGRALARRELGLDRPSRTDEPIGVCLVETRKIDLAPLAGGLQLIVP
jgi:hypothetical protein